MWKLAKWARQDPTQGPSFSIPALQSPSGPVSDPEAKARLLAITAVLRKLPAKKAPGPDGIPNELLKKCRDQLAPAVTAIFNACLQTGYYPIAFKQSTTVVLRKPQKEDYTQVKSYRPIALLNTLGKALEKLVATRLSEAAEEHSLLPDT
uniref:LINE-1 retrotransposable element ORF2 protein n=1 Tax=Passalora fulva TaxID=5499 RepID=A0A9Q8PH93_PASFU